MDKHVPNNITDMNKGRHYMPRCFHFGYRRKIGLLGGSFNPAHEGHIALSEAARQLAKCDEIWWLVSPQNPLKSSKDMADFKTRLSFAREFTKGKNWLRVVDIEQSAGISKSIDVMKMLKSHARKSKFIWLMGSDNLRQLPLWYEAKKLPYLMPFMVFRRSDDFYPSLESKGRYLFGRTGRVKKAHSLFHAKTPCLYIDSTFHQPISSTQIRAKGSWR